MNNILELLKNEKVEWKKLGELCEDKFWIMPKTPEFNEEYSIPYITGKNIKNWEINFDNVSYISEEDYNKMCSGRKILKNDILISMIGTIGKIACVNTDVKFYGQNLYLIRLNNKIILNRFFYHFFSQSDIQNSLISKKNTSSQGYIKAGQIENILIPIPSLETQAEIVKILDEFEKNVTELKAALKIELELRKKQYSYYRDKLLSEDYLNKHEFGENVVEWKKLGEIGEFYGGITGKTKEDFNDGNAKFITYKNVFANSATDLNINDKVKIGKDENQRKLMYGDILFTGSSETINECGMSSVITKELKEDIYLNSFCFFLRLNNKNLLLPDFSKHLFRSEFIRTKICKTAAGVTRYNVSKNLMKNIEIPVPSLKLQNKVVEILDKFQEYVENASGLLPAEIELRKNQYEYYREKLLTFEEKYDNKARQGKARQGKTRLACLHAERIISDLYFKYLVEAAKIVGVKLGVEFKKLGEVCLSITTGLNPRKNFKLNDENEGELTSWYITTKDYSNNEKIEFVEGKTARITEEARKIINKRSKLQINDILFSAVGTVGKIALLDIEPNNFDVNESTFVLKPNTKNIIPKFLVHYLRSPFIQNEVKKSLKGSTLAGIRKNNLEDLLIPVPSLAVQEHVVSILDKFEALVNDISQGLPKEIEFRKNQYEYYREKLLTFNKN